MDYYNQIKNILINNEIYKRTKDYSKNKSDLESYYNVGKILVDAQGGEIRAKYGDKLIKEYSEKLTKELGSGYSTRSLKLMRKFYLFQKGQPVVAQLSWSHYVILLSLKNINIINYYIEQVIKRNLSKRELHKIIKNKEYDRLPVETRNKIIKNESLDIGDEIKNPIILYDKNNLNKENIKEKILKQLILENIGSFLKQLGNGFCYIDEEYKINIGNSFNYIDILLYNYIYKCFIVVELKVNELKKEYIGQTEIYMNYIDKNIKQNDDNKTIGLIVVKENNEFVIKYSSDKRIKAVEYKII